VRDVTRGHIAAHAGGLGSVRLVLTPLATSGFREGARAVAPRHDFLRPS
jgi:hypothetical protein